MMRAILPLAAIMTALPAAAQTQAQMNRDAAAEWRAADAAMTAQWRATYAEMKRRDAADTSRGGFGFAAAALASQRAWIGFRDAQCAIEAGKFHGGTMAPMARSGCLTRLTRERAGQLAALISKDPQ